MVTAANALSCQVGMNWEVGVCRFHSFHMSILM